MIINYKDMPDNFSNVSSDDIIELEPCPFCGSRAYLNYDSRRRNYGHCSKCHADGGGHWDEKEAIKLWNNRVYYEEKMTALEKWKNDFKGFISELSMPKDDYNGILEYIDEVPIKEVSE